MKQNFLSTVNPAEDVRASLASCARTPEEFPAAGCLTPCFLRTFRLPTTVSSLNSSPPAAMEQSHRSFPSYLALSIFNMLCCCFPLGIVALICSLRVENAAGLGDTERASKASRTAKILNIVGIVLGIVSIIIVVIIFIVAKNMKHD